MIARLISPIRVLSELLQLADLLVEDFVARPIHLDLAINGTFVSQDAFAVIPRIPFNQVRGIGLFERRLDDTQGDLLIVNDDVSHVVTQGAPPVSLKA